MNDRYLVNNSCIKCYEISRLQVGFLSTQLTKIKRSLLTSSLVNLCMSEYFVAK